MGRVNERVTTLLIIGASFVTGLVIGICVSIVVGVLL